MSTGIVLDERYMDHQPGGGHPERPQRIEVLLPSLPAEPGVVRIAPRLATAEEITLVHDPSHFEAVASTAGRSHYAFDPDTPVSARSFETACLAAGGIEALVDAVVAGEVRNGFALVRPPGHHAERDRAMGFCLFNNVAIAAAYARARHGFERILVMDWDVHHGNGTQHSFAADPGILFISTHRFPFYPGTGALTEIGRGDGAGFTVNIPFPGGFGDAEYLEAFRTVVEPVARQFAPQLVLISAGFDAHHRDPLGGMAVTEQGFAAMARSLLRVADESAAGRCIAVLEGGYDLRAMRDSALAVLRELAGHEQATSPPEAPSSAGPILDALRREQRDFWDL